MHDYTEFDAPLPHPGETLQEDFPPQYGLTAGSLAKAMGLKDRTRIDRLVREQQPITADTALRLARVFGTSAEFWMNMQVAHDLSRSRLRRRRSWPRSSLSLFRPDQNRLPEITGFAPTGGFSCHKPEVVIGAIEEVVALVRAG